MYLQDFGNCQLKWRVLAHEPIMCCLVLSALVPLYPNSLLENHKIETSEDHDFEDYWVSGMKELARVKEMI